MVNLIVSAYDQQGRPVTNLRKRDFDVIEDGAAQRIGNADSDETPFNLAILLDLSGSTQPDRLAMKNAARRFVELARPHDRVAVYALAGSAFHVISRLTDEREALLETIARLPDASGASPLYDAVVLAYAEDFPNRPGERNALIVISDGIDNRISGQEMPSRVSFKKLLRGAAQMNALIYPIFLRSGERFGRGWSHRARKQMRKLAERSGGRLFPALSIQDLEPVFALVEQELRSVYSFGLLSAKSGIRRRLAQGRRAGKTSGDFSPRSRRLFRALSGRAAIQDLRRWRSTQMCCGKYVDPRSRFSP